MIVKKSIRGRLKRYIVFNGFALVTLHVKVDENIGKIAGQCAFENTVSIRRSPVVYAPVEFKRK